MTTPNPESSGPPLRAIAMVLIALAILFAGLGAASLGGSGSGESEPAAATSTTAAPAAPAAPPVTSANPASTVTSTAGAPTTTSAPATTPATTTSAAGPAAAASASQADRSVPVRVFNNSTVSGLAAQTANELTSAGWTVSETGNYSYGLIQNTTVYYRTDNTAEKRAAETIAAELGVKAEPRFEGITSASPGVIVIVTSG